MEPINELICSTERKREISAKKRGGQDISPGHGSIQDGTGAIKIRFDDTPSALDELEKSNERLAIAGRIMAFRDFGKSVFLHIQDRQGKIQVYVRKDVLKNPAYELFKKFDISDIISVEGTIFKTRTGEVTLLAETIILLTKSLRPLPEKWHGLKDVEERYRKRYLDLIVNEKVKEVFITRARIIEFIRNYFVSRNFIEVETPMMQVVPGGAVPSPL